MSTKYSKEILSEAVSESTSVAGVLRYLGLKQAGGTQAHIARKIKEFEISTEHFLGQGWNRGGTDPKRKSASQILVVLPDGSNRPRRNQLLRAMLESGVDYNCVLCYNDGTWNGETLVLEIDHVDGNFLNNRLDNLRFMCPNCHSQQDTNKPNKYAPA